MVFMPLKNPGETASVGSVKSFSSLRVFGIMPLAGRALFMIDLFSLK